MHKKSHVFVRGFVTFWQVLHSFGTIWNNGRKGEKSLPEEEKNNNKGENSNKKGLSLYTFSSTFKNSSLQYFFPLGIGFGNNTLFFRTMHSQSYLILSYAISMHYVVVSHGKITWCFLNMAFRFSTWMSQYI